MMSFLRLSLVGFLFCSQFAFAANEATVMPEVTTQVTAPGDETAAQATSARSIASEASSEAKAVLTEKEIPLNVDVNKKMADSTSNSTRLFLTVFIMLSVMGTTYYMVRKYKLSNNINKSNTKIKILSQHYLGPKKSLAIVRVAGESILIGVTDQNISMIKSLSLLDEELPQVLPKNFSETMTEQEAVDNLEVDEFSFEGLKSTVTGKIKSMRNIQQ